MKFFCIVSWGMFLIASPGRTSAQAREIARLHTHLRAPRDRKNPEPDTAYVDTLNRLAHAFYGIDADSAFFYGRKAVEYAQSTGYARGAAEGLRMLGNTYEMVGDYANMLSNYHHSLDIADSIGDTRLIAKANSNIALFYNRRGNMRRLSG